MLTMTTYGTWLRGDGRGWVQNGIIFPPDPQLESDDRERMKHPVFTFPSDRLLDIGSAIGQSIIQRQRVIVHAMTVQTWHVHIVIGPTDVPLGQIVKCAKDAARWHLRPGRPIWATDYDKRFCFDVSAAQQRIQYVQKHNLRMNWPALPWPFITPFSPR